MADNPYPFVGIRVSEDERVVIEEEARVEHMPMSTLIRSIVMKELQARRERREAQRNRTAAAEAA